MAQKNKKINNMNLLSKFKGVSKKTKFIIIIAIFTVMGGGYLTLKSFANTFIYASISDGRLRGYNAGVFTESSKNNAQVLQIQPNGGSGYADFSIPANTVFRYCYTARADKPMGAWFGASASGKGSGGLPPANTIIGTNYQSYCNKDANGSSSSALYKVQLFNTIEGQLNPGASMYISQLYVEIVSSSPAPTPAPTK